AEPHERVCGCSHSHQRRRTAPCRTPGCNLSPALDLDVEPPFVCRYEPCEATRPDLPARSPRPACQAFFRRKPPSLAAEGVCGERTPPPRATPKPGYWARATFSSQTVPGRWPGEMAVG